MPFSKNIGKKIGVNISKNLSSKYSQILLDLAKQSATDVLKTSSERVIQKTTELTDDLIGNKSANRITEVSRSSPQNNSDITTNEHEKKNTQRNIYIYLQKKDRKLLMM